MERKLVLKNRQSPGDILMLSAAVRDLHRTHPGCFLTDVRTSSMALWRHNPYITPLDENALDVEVIDCHYPLVHQSNQLPYHFIHGFRLDLQEKLGVEIRPHAFRGEVYLTDEEKSAPTPVDDAFGRSGESYWIIVSGGKKDFTNKWWDPLRCQTVVDHFRDRLLFVQCGAVGDNHHHPPLRGVINLVGKTDLRQMVRLMYHADGVICPVTMLMHLAAAVETRPGRPRNRPCVVVAGGREPSQWAAYPTHAFLHTNGCLPCCDHGGCWKSRIVALNDGNHKDNRLCLRPIQLSSGQTLPLCMDMITADDVIHAVERYLEFDRQKRQDAIRKTDGGDRAMPQVHTVQQGECMASIAKQYNFADYHAIYDHPKNAQLKQKRPNPNILATGDLVYIPDKDNKTSSAGTSQQHNYKVKGSSLRYRTVIRDGKGKPIANTPYVLKLQDKVLTGSTDGSGLLEKDLPLEAESAQLTLTALKMSWTVHFGHLDPIDTPSGVQGRLKSLGYNAGPADGSQSDQLQTALKMFQKDNGLPISGTVDAATKAKLQDLHGC